MVISLRHLNLSQSPVPPLQVALGTPCVRRHWGQWIVSWASPGASDSAQKERQLTHGPRAAPRCLCPVWAR